MSGYALVTQDASGSLAFSARKKASDSTSGAGALFDQTLAESETDAASSPTSSATSDAAAPGAATSAETASGAVAKATRQASAADGDLWRALPIFGDEARSETSARATADPAAAAPYANSSASNPIGGSLLARNMAAARLDSAGQSSTPLVSSQLATGAAEPGSSPEAPTTAIFPSKTSALQKLDRKLAPSAVVAPEGEGAAAAAGLQADSSKKDQVPPVAQFDERMTGASFPRDSKSLPSALASPALTSTKTSATKKIPIGSEADSTPAATKAWPSAPSDATPAILAGPLASSPANAVAVPQNAASGLAAGDKNDIDSVARIGAALAASSARGAASGVTEKSSADAEGALGASEATTQTAVHVVGQNTWLQPVSPLFSPGLNRAAAVDRAALETPRSNARAEDSAKADMTAPGLLSAKPATVESSVSALPTPSGTGAFGGAAITSSDDRDGAQKGAAAPAATAAEASTAIPLAAAPRRDLEITLAPKDLGGLAVRLKSAGDRLDISVVAEKGETARMISDRSANLASQLQGAGIGLGGIDIMAAAKQVSNASDLPASSNPGASAGGSNADAGGNSQAASQGRDPSGRDRQDQGHDQSDKTGDPRLSSGDRGLYL